MITQDYVKQILHYDPETGIFRWRIKSSPRVEVGQAAGCVKSDGYVTVGINGKQYKAHRLAWLYENGEFPYRLDHRDRDRTNNRICNLRPADYHLNGINRGLFRNNKSGFKGVFWYGKVGKWQADLTVRRVVHYLGRFDTLEEAVSARNEAEVRLLPHFRNTEETV